MSPAMTAIFDQAYKDNRERAGLVHKISARLEAWMHRRVAEKSGGSVLELGAGTLNHLAFEDGEADYDVVEPQSALYEDKVAGARIHDVYRDISEIDATESYRRIISIAALEHMTNLPAVLARAGLLLDAGGKFQAGIPSEGGLLWGLSWRVSSGVAFRLRTGLDWSEYMRHEHVNTAPEILALSDYFFANVTIRRFPLRPHHLSLYVYFEATDPHLDRCRRFAE